MRRYFDTKLGMYKSIATLLSNNAATITSAGTSILTTYRNALNGKIDLIRTASEETSKKTQGITLRKADAEDKAANIATVIAGMLYSYANDNDNITLKEDVKGINISTLKSKKDEEIIDILYIVLSKAQEVSTVTPPATNPLVAYGLKLDVGDVGDPGYVPGTLAQFEAAIAAYSALTTAPRDAITNRKTYNGVLRGLYKEVDDVLDNMDKVVKGMKETFPLFYVKYQNARNIIDPLRQYTRIEGKITNKGLPLSDVTVTIVSTANPLITYEVISDEEGAYTVRTPKFRESYNVKFSKMGYGDMEQSGIKVKLGKATGLDIQMNQIQAN